VKWKKKLELQMNHDTQKLMKRAHDISCSLNQKNLRKGLMKLKKKLVKFENLMQQAETRE